MLLRRMAVAIGLLFAALFAQGPEFAQQYRQRLAGAIDELSRIVATFQAEAATHALTTEDAISRLEGNSDPLARERGQDMESDIARLDRLKASLASFRDSEPVRRLVTLARNFDPETARRAMADYEPALPTTTEALLIAGLGWLFGWGGTHLCAWPLRRRLARRSRQREEARASLQGR